MKKMILSILMLTVIIVAVAQNKSFQKDQKKFSNEAVETVKKFRKTTPFVLNEERLSLLNTFETYSDSFPNTSFREYLTKTNDAAEEMEHMVPILYSYREAFDKVLYEVKNTKVKRAEYKMTQGQ